MPSKRSRNKNRHKNNQPPQNYTPNHKPNYNQNSSLSHLPYHQNQRNSGRSRSLSQSLRPGHKPHTPKRSPPQQTPCPSRHSFTKPQTPASSLSNNLASKATHTLRTSLFTAASGICKRRISLGLSLTLPTSAASKKLKTLLLKAVEDARDCIVKMDFSCSSSSAVNVSAKVPITVGEDDESGTSTDAAPYEAIENGWRDSGIAMDTDDPPPAVADGWDDVDAGDEAVVGKGGDHGCVDLAREHGIMVQRMRWESSEYPGVGTGDATTPSALSQGAYWSTSSAPTAPKKMSKEKKQSKSRADDWSGGGLGDDEIMTMPAGDGSCISKHCLGSLTIVSNIDAKINRAQNIYKVKKSTGNRMEIVSEGDDTETAGVESGMESAIEGSRIDG